MNNIYKSIAKLLIILIVLIGVNSCGTEHDFAPSEAALPVNAAQLKFINTAVGPSGINFGVNIFINDVKSSGVVVTVGLPVGTSYGGIYPASANYAAVPSGNQILNLVIPFRAAVLGSPATCPIPELPVTTIATAPFVTEAGKNYSRFLVGVSPNYSIFSVTDDLSITNINDPNAYIRFFNFITNSPTTGYDLVFIRTRPATPTSVANTTTVKTFSAIRYLGGNPVFETLVPIAIVDNTADVVQLRLAGTTTVVATLTGGFVARPGKVYTFIARGVVGGLSCSMPSATGVPSASVNIPTMAFHTNR